MTLQDKFAALDSLKRDFIVLRERIEKLENEIAVEDCPIKLGETITIREDGKMYQGVVKEVVAEYFPYAIINPTVGNRPTWVARGPRINRGTGAEGKHRFELAGNSAEKEDGVWVKRVPKIDDIISS